MNSALATIATMLLAGYLVRRLGRFPDNAADVLNRFVIDVCVPATILRLLPRLTFDASLVILAVTPWIMAAIAWAVSKVAERLLRLSAGTQTVLFLCTALGNTSFLGFPLCGALLGPSSVPLAAVYDQLGSFLLLSIVTPFALARASTMAKPTLGTIVRKVVLFPPFLAFVLALIPRPESATLDQVLATAASPLIPLAMFAVGLKVRVTPPRPARILALGLTLKMAVFPLIAWGLAKSLGATGLVLKVAVLETAMPTMITAGALLMAAGVGVELAAALVGWGVVLSLVTIPAWAMLLG